MTIVIIPLIVLALALAAAACGGQGKEVRVVEVVREVPVIEEVPVSVVREVPVIEEVPVSVVREVPVIEEVLVEVIREVEKEAPAVVAFPRHDFEEPVINAGDNRYFGELVLIDGCLRLDLGDGGRGQGHTVPLLVVWPPGFSLSAKGSSIRVSDETGLIVAHLGDDVRLSGGYPGRSDDSRRRLRELEQKLSADCPGDYLGRYVVVGDEVSTVGPDEPTVVPLPGSTLYFQRSKTPRGSGETELALLIGELTLEGDCLRVRADSDGASYFVVWPPGFIPHIEDGVVHVRNGGGQLIARVGDRLRMGGGYSTAPSEHKCLGTLFGAGRVRRE